MPFVKADTTLAAQFLINLCTNAYQAMEGTGGMLTIGLRYQDHADEPGNSAAARRIVGSRHGTGNGLGDG